MKDCNLSETIIIRPAWIRNIEEVLLLIFKHLLYSEKAIKTAFAQHRKWGARDRAFVAENVYDIVRWNKRIRWALNLPADDFFQNEADKIIPLMIAGFLSKKYQLDLLSSNGYRLEEFIHRWNTPPTKPIEYSMSEWLWSFGLEQLENRWEKEVESMNKQAEVFIRINTLLTNSEEVRDFLKAEDVETEYVSGADEALKLVSRCNITHLKSFRKGLYDIQDAASQQVAPFCQLNEGMFILDACAGAGGKSVHLATILKNTGKVVSTDIEPLRLKQLTNRAKRMKLKNIEVHYYDAKHYRQWKGFFDRVLLDVPCTGSGTIRRNPDAKWRINSKMLQHVIDQQRKIIELNASTVKCGGKLIYSTCSIFPIENQKQIEFLLSINPDFELEEMKTLYPSETGWDGFFMARLRRK